MTSTQTPHLKVTNYKHHREMNPQRWEKPAEEKISEIEDQINDIKQEGKIREKRVKRNEQTLQEIWDYVKRPNLRFIGVPECDRENESELENTLQDIIQENFPNLARQANIQIQEIQRPPQQYSSRRATPGTYSLGSPGLK